MRWNWDGTGEEAILLRRDILEKLDKGDLGSGEELGKFNGGGINLRT